MSSQQPASRSSPVSARGPALSDAAHISVTDMGAYVGAIVLTFVGLLFAVSGGDIVGPASSWILALLVISGLLIAYLSLRVGSRVLALRNAGKKAQTGARLHLRFVMLFAANGVIPVILIALFSALTIGQGVQAWFSEQVREAVQATRILGNQSVDKTAETTKVDIAAMAVDLNASAIQLKADPQAYRDYLALQADRRGFVAAYVLNAQGTKLAQAQRPQGVPDFIMPDAGDFATAQAGDVSINIDPSAVVRALYRLDAFSNSYLAVVRLPEPGQLALFQKAKAAVYAYQVIEERQGLLRLLFALAYLEIVLLVLIGSVWLGLVSAGRISAPIGLLADAAERVRGGDMSARVAQVGGGDEISALATTFNKMTGELQFQRRALEEAAEYAETRSAFIGAVLEGVSAGVVSLDGTNCVRAANGSASRLLHALDDRLEGRDFSVIAPEFMAIVSSARPLHPAQGQAERLVGAETLLFDVRAAYAGDDLVVTFDDVSGLLAAQRQAAWKDVARRIAHEIKNPLTPIQLSAERLKRKYADVITTDKDVFIRMTDTIVRQVTDIGRMVDEFSSYARMPSPKFAVDDLSEALRQAVFAQRIASPDIEVTSTLPPEPVLVSMDTRLLIQAFANILKNAGEGIATRRARDGGDMAGYIEVSLHLNGKMAWVEVVDNGIGFPVHDRRRLLEPYMTTRAKGTGLGLAIVARVMEEHGGKLELADRTDGQNGARVLMNLPICVAENTSNLPDANSSQQERLSSSLPMAAEILIVDDEADIRDLVGGILEDEGYVVRYAADSDGALDAFRTRRPDLVVLDVWLQGSRLDGLEILSVVQGIDPTIPIVLISGHGTIETAVSALKRGAFDFIEKPFKSDRLILIISRALESARLRRENMALRARAVAGDELIGESTVMLQLRAAIEKIAPMNSRVLITGPSGSGKEVIARALHAGSQRADGPFVVISAAAIAPERMESELFGEETSEGRPTKIGVFEHAHNGTLLLDEIAEMPMETQSKILRVLVEQRFRRLGGSSDVSVNVRVISSTARDLRDAISIGRFREDLFHRLNVVPIRSPALAERRDDVPRLVEHFSKRVAEANGVAQRQFGPEALAAMQAASWPGNVRELRNLVERMLILASGDASEPIDAAALALDGVGVGELADRTGLHQLVSLPLREARELFEREYLAAQITRFGGNISRTASFIGMERSALHRKLKSLGVEGTRGFDLEG